VAKVSAGNTSAPASNNARIKFRGLSWAGPKRGDNLGVAISGAWRVPVNDFCVKMSTAAKKGNGGAAHGYPFSARGTCACCRTSSPEKRRDVSCWPDPANLHGASKPSAYMRYTGRDANLVAKASP